MKKIFCADIGNTHSRISIFNNPGDEPEYSAEFPSAESHLMASEIPDGSKIWVSSVCGKAFDRFYSSLNLRAEIIKIDSSLATGIENRYENPGVLGSDRLCNAVAASRMSKSGFAVVVDAGTATDFEVVIDGNVFEGGLIAPGIHLMVSSLVCNTDIKTNFISSGVPDIIGKNTEENIRSGSFYASIAVIDYATRAIEKKYGRRFERFLTGGFGKEILPYVDGFVYDKYFTLKGASFIAQLNM